MWSADAYRTAFAKFDGNGDGTLTPAELRNALALSCGEQADADVIVIGWPT